MPEAQRLERLAERLRSLDPVAPSPAGRRALRSQLGSGLGVLGRLRALWALPPARIRTGPVSERLREQ